MQGMPRRVYTYQPEMGWGNLNLLVTFGAVVFTVSFVMFLANVLMSRSSGAIAGDNPWDAGTLEWATSSPPPPFNFAFLPEVSGEDAFWQLKKRASEQTGSDEKPEYRDIEIPRNSPTGFVCAFFATVMGFALIWHIWWMVAAGAIGAFATFVVFAWRDKDVDVIPAAEVTRIDRSNRPKRRLILREEAAD
jgi:cytochrome o ubiquinol oxidase subunit 1